jgi:restriction endonuclease S subunit
MLATMLTSYLDSKYSDCKRVPLGSLVHKVRPGEVIRTGSLVLVAAGDRRLRLRTTPQDTVHKSFSEPIFPNEFAAEHKVTQAYLYWYLTQAEVANYLVENATGAVFVRVPRKVLHAIPVPLPVSVRRIKPVTEFSVVKTNNRFTKVVGEMHSD